MTFDLNALKETMRQAGATRLFTKYLRRNNNSQQQFYISRGKWSNVLELPMGDPIYCPELKTPNYKASLKFAWIDTDGLLADAPEAQLILYPDYPEIRLGSLIERCANPPRDLLNQQVEGRILFLGIAPKNQIIGYIAARGSLIAEEYNALGPIDGDGVLREISLLASGNDKQLLLSELKRIHMSGLIESKSLKPNNTIVPCTSSQCAGYTLEAELGLTRNSSKEPDFHGWEVKTHPDTKRKPITLFTPSPSSGHYTDMGIEGFVNAYGVAGKSKHPGRLRFTGGYRHNQTFTIGKLADPNMRVITTHLEGYDPIKNVMGINGTFSLKDGSGNLLCVWDYGKLLKAWKKKHSKAVYVPSQRYPMKGTPTHYRYSNVIRLGEGADPNKFFRAIYENYIYLDPVVMTTPSVNGKIIKYSNFPFRIETSRLYRLYDMMTTVDVLDSSTVSIETL